MWKSQSGMNRTDLQVFKITVQIVQKHFSQNMRARNRQYLFDCQPHQSAEKQGLWKLQQQNHQKKSPAKRCLHQASEKQEVWILPLPRRKMNRLPPRE